MSQKAMRKNLRQSITKSLGRYIAIVAIIALGAGIFIGLNTTKSDMVATGQKYTDEQNMFDLRLLSSYGWDLGDVEKVAALDGVEDAEGMVSLDVIVNLNGGNDLVYRFHSIPEKINKVVLKEGRMPESPDECLAGGFQHADDIIGTQITISENNDDDTIDSLACKTYTVVGYVSTPLYMNMERGTTSIGSGSLTDYLYIPLDGFDVDYYTEIDVTIPGDYTIYSEKYNNALDDAAERLKEAVTPIAIERMESLKAQAEEEYADGLAEYEDGYQEFMDGRQEAIDQLDDARQQLVDGQKEIDDNRKLLEDGLVQIQDAQTLLSENAATLAVSQNALSDAKAEAYAQLAASSAELMTNYRTVLEAQKQVNDGLEQINSGLDQIDSGISQLESGLEQIDSGIQQIDLLLGILDVSVQAAQSALDMAKNQAFMDEEQIAELEAKLAELEAKQAEYAQQRQELVDMQAEYSQQLEDLKVQREEIAAQKTELEATKQTLDEAMDAIDAGFLELQNAQSQVDNQFTAAEAQLESGQVQLEEAQRQLDANKAEAEAGLTALDEAQAEIDAGWEEYETSRYEVQRELDSAWLELVDAKQQLADARETLDAMTETTVYALDRNTNTGYTALDSNSDIVAGVSRVFPLFFLLVAALVCITTMSRMVSEERTEIGTLKALGYSNGAIISKYMIYAGSGALIGCGLGLAIGSVVFPMILWRAYCMMLYITDLCVLKVDWGLFVLVLVAYTAAVELVTWYCCRRELREVPAELIRPKAPTAGKKIILEYFPFWEKFSFLNKVMLRNTFRYRQRLLMMLVGIGGCTALLVTGFGIRDSIADIAGIQFREVMTYDVGVYFSEAQDEDQQAAFREELRTQADQIHFFHQRSAELDHNDKTREVYLIASDDGLTDHMDFHSGDKPLSMPGTNEALVSVGAADAMGIEVGDEITVRDSDMNTLTVTVSGIFDNNVYSYVIVTPETIERQWGEAPEQQMAYVNIRENQNVHTVSAKISGMDNIMTVMVCQDIEDSVNSMLDALDLVVVTVVICAALLAVIVLYNLININIKERIREIATIKVLGFNSAETAAYVFKENLLLSVMGAIIGLPAGWWLLCFVMSQIKVDMVWFQARASVLTYILAFVMTMLSALAVDFIFHFKLEKINMAEALKSVE